MTNEELAQEIQNGNLEKSADLWRQIERLVHMKARKCMAAAKGRFWIEYDDLIQAGGIAMMMAIKHFQPERGFKFLTYLDKTLKTAFADVGGWRTLRGRNDPLNAAVSLDGNIDEDEGEPLTLYDAVADPEAQREIEHMVDYDHVHKALTYLAEEERRVIELVYFHDVEKKDLTGEERKHLDWGLRDLRHPYISRRILRPEGRTFS